jgi:hypothetical protein
MKTIQTIGTAKLTIKRIIALALLLTAAPFMSSYQAHAAQIGNRSITLSSSVGAATGVTYNLATAAIPTTGTAIKSVEVQMCTTSSGACTTPSGFTAATSTLNSQPTGLGAGTGWTVDTGTAGSLRIVNAANATNPSGAVAIVWGGVTNPTATNTTYYGRVTTFSDATWTTSIDSGTVALSTSAQIQVDLSVGETLTFCTGTSITGQNCATAAGSVVNLGIGSTTGTSTGTSIIAASTNGSSGYTVTVNGATLTSGANNLASTLLAAIRLQLSELPYQVVVLQRGLQTTTQQIHSDSEQAKSSHHQPVQQMPTHLRSAISLTLMVSLLQVHIQLH